MVTVTTMAAVTCVGRAVTGVRVLAPVSVVGVVTGMHGVGVDPTVSVALGRRAARDLPGVIVLLAPRARVCSVLVVRRAHRFLSGRPRG